MEKEFAQIGEDWQEGVIEPLTGDEEEAARSYINKKLIEWKISSGDEYLDQEIMRAWDEWNATDEAAEFVAKRKL